MSELEAMFEAGAQSKTSTDLPVRLAMKHGASLDAVDRDGHTAEDIAQTLEATELAFAKLKLEYGSD